MKSNWVSISKTNQPTNKPDIIYRNCFIFNALNQQFVVISIESFRRMHIWTIQFHTLFVLSRVIEARNHG